MKHVEVRQKYSAARVIFNSLLGVSSSDKTLRLMIWWKVSHSLTMYLNQSFIFELYDLLFQTSHIAIDHRIQPSLEFFFQFFPHPNSVKPKFDDILLV